jgi:hypothetical protein
MNSVPADISAARRASMRSPNSINLPAALLCVRPWRGCDVARLSTLIEQKMVARTHPAHNEDSAIGLAGAPVPNMRQWIKV